MRKFVKSIDDFKLNNLIGKKIQFIGSHGMAWSSNRFCIVTKFIDNCFFEAKMSDTNELCRFAYYIPFHSGDGFGWAIYEK